MGYPDLKNKPLAEVIFEIRWGLEEIESGVKLDPNHKLIFGRLYDRVKKDYPELESLPISRAPEELAAHLVTHRFRAKKDGWPLIQIGPGILTVNDTTNYNWDDFRQRILNVIQALTESHPQPKDIKFISSELRYIDAFELNYKKENSLDFLREKLGIELSFPKSLFSEECVSPQPAGLRTEVSFPCKKPNGIKKVRIAMGSKDNMPSMLLEHVVSSSGREVPNELKSINDWIDAANEVCHDWFFTLIEGDLLKELQ